MEQPKAPIIFRSNLSQGVAEKPLDSPLMKTYLHRPQLNIENKITIFETHAFASKD